MAACSPATHRTSLTLDHMNILNIRLIIPTRRGFPMQVLTSIFTCFAFAAMTSGATYAQDPAAPQPAARSGEGSKETKVEEPKNRGVLQDLGGKISGASHKLQSDAAQESHKLQSDAAKESHKLQSDAAKKSHKLQSDAAKKSHKLQSDAAKESHKLQ